MEVLFMRKLVFMLRVNPNPNSTAPKNLEISTHKGARLTITGNRATVLDVTDDEMTDSELQMWYRTRYSGMGMGITLMHDPVVQTTPAKTADVKVQVEKPVEQPVKDTKTEAAAATQRFKEKIENGFYKKDQEPDNGFYKKDQEPESVLSNDTANIKQENVTVEDTASVKSVKKETAASTVESKPLPDDSVDYKDLQSFIWE